MLLLQSLRKITEVLLASAASFLAIASLILLFMLVFAIIGLHVYGGTQQSDEYPNFSTFLLSVTTMFQVGLHSACQCVSLVQVPSTSHCPRNTQYFILLLLSVITLLHPCMSFVISVKLSLCEDVCEMTEGLKTAERPIAASQPCIEDLVLISHRLLSTMSPLDSLPQFTMEP